MKSEANDAIEGINLYKRAVLSKLAMWDWSKQTWNTFSNFLDDAYTVLEDYPNVIKQLNLKLETFEKKYGMTITQAEIKVYLRINGVSTRRIIKEDEEDFDTFGSKPIRKSDSEREIKWMNMIEDLRMIKVWTQTQLKNAAAELGLMENL